MVPSSDVGNPSFAQEAKARPIKEPNNIFLEIFIILLYKLGVQ
jgi:hypothetical protein